jgi:hypothetical protein
VHVIYNYIYVVDQGGTAGELQESVRGHHETAGQAGE